MIILSMLGIVCLLVFSVALICCLKRKRTKYALERSGLPTVFWTPRFICYRPFEENKKLSPSTITRILPRMQKLGGPYGMFGTVYGIATPVIHVAHPIPAGAILTGSSRINGNDGPSSPCTPKTGSLRQRRKRLSLVNSSGVSKAPAYNHFKNFCGDGVFTADGNDWKAKRAALIHCLVRGTASSTSDISQRLEKEANRAGDVFCHQIKALRKGKMTTDNGGCVVVSTNIVPLLQRATVGLIYKIGRAHV